MPKFLGSCAYPEAQDEALSSELGMSNLDLFRALSRSDGMTYAGFRNKADRYDINRLANKFGYAPNAHKGLTMARDPQVTYHRTPTTPEPFYFILRRGTAYVFADRKTYKNRP